MKPLLIKVCGMRDADNVRQVEALTPDMMGFICWEGSRRLSRLPDYLPETCRRVGVFVNPEIGYVQERLKTFRLDLVQLHGHETPEFCRSIKEEGLKSGRALQIIKAFGVAPDYSITGASVISHAETSGLGAKITESEFLDSFVGQTEGMAVTKDGGSIETITAATISSRAMANAANTAIAVCKSLG